MTWEIARRKQEMGNKKRMGSLGRGSKERRGDECLKDWGRKKGYK